MGLSYHSELQVSTNDSTILFNQQVMPDPVEVTKQQKMHFGIVDDGCLSMMDQ